MVFSQSRPLPGGDKEPDMIFYNSDSINNNYGISNFENQSKTDGVMIKITNTGNNDIKSTNSTRSSSSRTNSSRKCMDNLFDIANNKSLLLYEAVVSDKALLILNVMCFLVI